VAEAMPGADPAAPTCRDRKLVGDGRALILARSINDPALSDEILPETRAWNDDRNGPVPAPRKQAA